jgi:hypothetical protein
MINREMARTVGAIWADNPHLTYIAVLQLYIEACRHIALDFRRKSLTTGSDVCMGLALTFLRDANQAESELGGVQ